MGVDFVRVDLVRRPRLMYLLTGLRCDDDESALISSMTRAKGTVVLVKSVPVIGYCSVRMATAWLAA